MTVFKTSQKPAVLIVDVDDTLIRSDILFEQTLKILKTKPLYAFAMPFWLMRGAAHLKHKMTDLVTIQPELLPYRESVLKIIHQSQSENQRIILASASNERVVASISKHLGLTEEAIASNCHDNIKGRSKLLAIKKRIGNDSFTYIADSSSDLEVWRECEQAIVVNPSFKTVRSLKKLPVTYDIIRDRCSLTAVIIKQMRVIQWIKNCLIFVPLLAAHHFFEFSQWRCALMAALSFSFFASSVYVMNDLLDVESDRVHARKRRRPFASGDLPISWGLILLPALIVAGLLCSRTLPADVHELLAIYYLLNILYSWKLKEVVIIDTILLASFYTIRIIAGGAATKIPVSPWLLSMSIFFFFGLALVKRYTELQQNKDQQTIRGRGYVIADKLPIFVIGIASSLIAALILVLYLNSHDVAHLYAYPDRLWLITPVLLYWSSRLWLLTFRGEVHDDPVIFSLTDRMGWMVLLVCAVIFAAAI